MCLACVKCFRIHYDTRQMYHVSLAPQLYMDVVMKEVKTGMENMGVRFLKEG